MHLLEATRSVPNRVTRALSALPRARAVLLLVVTAALALLTASLPAQATDPRRTLDLDLSFYGDLPIEAKVGLHIDQITHVDQKAENFGAVGTLRIEWQDENLVFEPPPNVLPIQRYTGGNFADRADEENLIYPAFTIFNQQGRRFSDDAGVVVFPEGRAVFGERFTVTLQAPDFDFREYPFDVQRFFFAIDTEWPQDILRFVADPDFSGLGDQLGEEEWIFTNELPELTTRDNIFGNTSSRVTFVFSAGRHIWYYVLRIFVPLLIIVSVSWVTFFLQDFSKRVDISAGNLLVYVAFNFTISSELPRLGYMTFMDTILAASFVITSLTVIWNVLLRRLEIAGKEKLARTVDAYTFWVYPGAFVLVVYLTLGHYFPDWSLGKFLNLFG